MVSTKCTAVFKSLAPKRCNFYISVGYTGLIWHRYLWRKHVIIWGIQRGSQEKLSRGLSILIWTLSLIWDAVMQSLYTEYIETWNTYWEWSKSSGVARWIVGLLCWLLVLCGPFDPVDVGSLTELCELWGWFEPTESDWLDTAFSWPKSRPGVDSSVEMLGAGSSCVLPAFSGNVCVGRSGVKMYELSGTASPGHCRGCEMDSVGEVCERRCGEGLSGESELWLHRTSLPGWAWEFWLFPWSWREASVPAGIEGFMTSGQDEKE